MTILFGSHVLALAQGAKPECYCAISTCVSRKDDGIIVGHGQAGGIKIGLNPGVFV